MSSAAEPRNTRQSEIDDDIPFADFYHVGLHKTASTFVQRRVLPAFGGRLVRIRDGQQGEPHEPASGPLIYMNDSISGDVDNVDFDGAVKIAAVNPKAKIIIGIRSQYSAVRSMYWLSVKAGDTRPFGDFVNAIVANKKLDYHALVDSYRSVFGADNVHILLFEEVTQAPSTALAKLAAFVDLPVVQGIADDAPVRASPGDLVIAARRRSNQILRGVPEPAKGFVRNVMIAQAYRLERVIRGVTRRPLKFISPGQRELELIESTAASNRSLFETLPASDFSERYPGMNPSPEH